MAVIQLYERSSNTWVPAQDTDVTDMVASGKYGLQSGIDIPVTFSDGTMGTVPSDKFEEGAFNKQVRFQTQEDLKAYDAQQQEAINQKVYGDAEDTTVGAFSQGFARGMVPGADAIMEGMGGLVGHADDVKEGLRQTKERHPIASTIGDVVGMVSNPILGKAGSAVRGIGESVAGTALEKLGSTVVSKVGSQVAGASLEGALYGLPEGMSEATLGDPHEVAQNLVAGPAMGALFGGAFGTAFAATKAATPFFKSAINKATDAGEDLVSSTLRGAGKAAVNIVPSLAEQAEFKQAAGELFSEGGAEVYRAYQKYGKAGMDQLNKMVPKLQADLEDQATTLKSNLDKFAESQPKAIKEQIETDWASANGNLPDAMKSTLSRLEANKQTLYSVMKADPEAGGGLFQEIYDETIATIKTLELTKDLKARSIAKDIQSRLNGEMAAREIFIQDGKVVKGRITQGSEGILGRELAQKASLGLENDKIPMAAKDALGDYLSSIKGLNSSGKYGPQLDKLDQMADSFDAFRQFATKSMGATNAEVKNSVIKSILTDPRKARDFDSLLSNLSEFMPEFQAYRDSGANAVQKMNALREASAKFENMRNATFDRGLTTDDLQSLFDSFGTHKNVGDQISKLREAQAQLNVTDSGPVSKYVRLSRFLGNDIDPELAKLQPFESKFTLLDKLKDAANKKDGGLTGIASKIAVNRVARKIGRHLGGPILGEAIGIAATTAIEGGLNIHNTLRTVYKLDDLQRKSFRLIASATNRAIDTLTGGSVSKLGPVTAGAVGERYLSEKPRSVKDARKDFKERSDYLNQLTTDPHYLASEAQSRVAGLEYAPNIGAALATQFANTAFYLASNLPKNPLAGTGIPFKDEAPWQPSDSALSSFERRVSAAENPARAILDFGNGKVSPEALQTLQALHPAAFAKLQKGLYDAIMGGKADITYSKKLQIGQILGIRSDSSLDPRFVMAMQANHSAQGPGAPPTTAKGPHTGGFHPSRLNINSDSHATDTSRVTFGH